MARPISFDPEVALEKAMELFWERGYHGVSVEDIVQATGLNRHSLYARYGSKLGLLKAALERYRSMVMDQIEGVLEQPAPARTRIERLLALRTPTVEHRQNGASVWCDVAERGCFALRVSAELRDANDDLGHGLDDMGGLLESKLADVIREGQASGEFRSDRSAESLAAVLVGGFMLPLVYAPAANRVGDFVAVLD